MKINFVFEEFLKGVVMSKAEVDVVDIFGFVMVEKDSGLVRKVKSLVKLNSSFFCNCRNGLKSSS